MNAKLCVCYASSDTYSPYTGVSILSLLYNNADVIDTIFLLDLGITDSNLEKIGKIVSDYEVQLVVVDVISRMKAKFEEIGLPTFRGSYATYARAFVSELIDRYNGKLLYIDSDTIVDGSIEELLELDMTNKAYAAVVGANQYTVGNDERILENGNRVYYACGVIMFNLPVWRKTECTEKIVSYIKEGKGEYRYADQTVINNVISEKLVCALHPKYNYWGHIYKGSRVYYEMSRGGWWSRAVIEEAKKSPAIIHYKGHVVHPWLKGNISELAERYTFYKLRSPWKDEQEHTVYYDENCCCETAEFKAQVDKQIRQLRYPAFLAWIVDALVFIKRKMLGEFV